MMQKNLLMRGFNFLCSRTSYVNAANLNHIKPTLISFDFHNPYTSKSEPSSENPNSPCSDNEIQNENRADVDDVSSAELKTQIDKFYKGDFEAIPTIFESILKRKLAGKHEESDDELMNEFLQDQPSKVSDEEFNSDAGSDSDE